MFEHTQECFCVQKHQAGLVLLWRTHRGAARCHEMGRHSSPAPPGCVWGASHSPWGSQDTPCPHVCWLPPAAGEPPPPVGTGRPAGPCSSVRGSSSPSPRRGAWRGRGPSRPCRSQHLAHKAQRGFFPQPIDCLSTWKLFHLSCLSVWGLYEHSYGKDLFL